MKQKREVWNIIWVELIFLQVGTDEKTDGRTNNFKKRYIEVGSPARKKGIRLF